MIFGLKKNMIIPAAFAMAGALLFTGCAPKQAVVKTDPVVDNHVKTVVFRIDGKDFTLADVDSAINVLIPRSSMHGSVSENKMEMLKTRVVNAIYEAELIYNHAEERKNFDATDQEINEKIDRIKKTLPNNTSLEDALKARNGTMDELKEIIKRDIILAKIKQAKNDEIKVQGDKNVDDDFLRDYYNKNLEKFVMPDQVLVSEILIRVDPSGGDQALIEGYKKADDLYKLIKKGRNFSKLAKENSQDIYAKDGGSMGWVHRDSLFEELTVAISQLKKGEVTKPVRTIYGYHIVRLDDIKPSEQLKFDEINKTSLRQDLLTKEYKRLYTAWIVELGKKAKVEVLLDEFKKYFPNS